MKSRTMVYLESEQLQALRTEAKTQGISLAELLRRLVHAHLEKRHNLATAPPSAFLRLVGLGSSGGEDISEHHDDYLGKALHDEHAG